MGGGLIVLKESESELVLWKPAGLASELRDENAEDSVKALVAQRRPGKEPRLPHRLDRVTCGILLVCLSKEAVAFHNERIQARRWEKYYLARVAPRPGVDPRALVGTHKAFLVEERGRARLVRSGGKPAWLEIVACAQAPGTDGRWHLLIRLLTGRFHQIRVMCEALGLPLPGDPLYDPEHRDPGELYLEHVLLRYEDFDARAPSTVFLPEAPARDAIAPELAARLAELARCPGLDEDHPA